MIDPLFALFLFASALIFPREYDVIDGKVISSKNAPVVVASTLKPNPGSNTVSLSQ